MYTETIITNQKKILVVDDSLIARRMVRFALQGLDYEILEAFDGTAAVRILYTQPVDLLITDLNMPNMDGLELSRIVRESHGMTDMPIIMLTQETGTKQREEARQVGVSLLIPKPFTPEQLFGLVKEILG